MQGLDQNHVFSDHRGAGGIGRATSTALGQAGSHVIITDVDSATGEATSAEISKRTRQMLKFVLLV